MTQTNAFIDAANFDFGQSFATVNDGEFVKV